MQTHWTKTRTAIWTDLRCQKDQRICKWLFWKYCAQMTTDWGQASHAQYEIAVKPGERHCPDRVGAPSKWTGNMFSYTAYCCTAFYFVIGDLWPAKVYLISWGNASCFCSVKVAGISYGHSPAWPVISKERCVVKADHAFDSFPVLGVCLRERLEVMVTSKDYRWWQ